MSNNTSVTLLGESLRGLADILDEAPSILGLVQHPQIPSQLDIVIVDPRGVREIGEALRLPVEARVFEETGRVHTSLDVRFGIVEARIFSISNAEEVGS